MPNIGPTFADELAAAGLGGLSMSWNSDGTISYEATVTQQQRDAVATVLAAHNPAAQRKNIIAFGTFIGRFTNAEYADLWQKRATAIAGNTGGMALVKQWDIAVAVGKVDLNTAAAQNFKSSLVSAGVLTQNRADIVFNGG